MSLEQKRILLEKKKAELNEIKLKSVPSKMSLHSGLMGRLKRQQERSFSKEIRSQKEDVRKKLLRVNELISSGSDQSNEDFNILKTPKRKSIRKMDKIKQNMGWFLK